MVTIDRPRCDALTAHGERCRREGSYPVVVDGRAVNLCGNHMAARRRGRLAVGRVADRSEQMETSENKQ